MGSEETMKGEVKYFNGEKGFGFISVPGIEKDIFFHVSVINDFDTTQVAVGLKVEIVGTEQAEKGLQATGVYVI